MSEIIISEAISRRRALSLVGLAAALGLAAPAVVLMASRCRGPDLGHGAAWRAPYRTPRTAW